jgi:pimeloyl-ACP methyl ester carboxylesterase/acyl carrier protein
METVSPDEILSELKNFVSKELLQGQDEDLDSNTPLLAWGIIDSLTMVSLLAFIEDKFSIHVPDEDVRPENFETLQVLTNLLVSLHPKQPKTAVDLSTTAPLRVLESYGVKREFVELPPGYKHHLVRTWGELPNWVLMPTLSSLYNSWGELLRLLIDEQSSVAFDLAGLGLSNSPKELPNFADHLEITIKLLERIIKPPMVLISGSVGSMLATEIARRKPEWVKALVVVGFGLIEDGQAWWNHLLEISKDLDVFLQTGYYKVPYITPAFRPLLEKRLSSPAYRNFLSGGVELMSTTFDNIKVPTLFVVGENDKLVEKSAVEKAAARIEKSTVKVLPYCGHFPQMERSRELFNIIKDFVHSNIS